MPVADSRFVDTIWAWRCRTKACAVTYRGSEVIRAHSTARLTSPVGAHLRLD